MLFHTPTFLVFFLAFLACYLPVQRKEAGIWVIIVFSNIFYGWWNWKFLWLLWATILVDYTLGRLLGRTRDPLARKLLVAASVATNLGFLGFFKYYNFFVATITSAGVTAAHEWHITDLTLPVGISFYVFQSMSYTINVYRREQEPITNLPRFAAFVCYFPQLVAGPIERLGHLLPQILRPAAITPERVASGIFLFCVGFFRKALADTFSVLVDPVFANIGAAAPVDVVFAVLGFGLQIYLDFTGYVDMARGVSRVIGIDLMLNFNAPYLSTSPREFWRRWHISLSQWLRDYLYISLGGNRHGLPRHLANLMITMLLGGLWHGAGLNFIVWGGLHGTYLVANTLWDKWRPPERRPQRSRAWRWAATGLSWLGTWLAVNYAWLYFRSHTFETAMIANRKIGEWLLHPALPSMLPGVILAVVAVIGMEFIIRFGGDSAKPRLGELTLRHAVLGGAVAGCLFLGGLILLAGVPTQQFIYFQF
jgi:D-alanyl-lipoteichoic acid acyltransferase DltB (MBOAT superfamily)